MGEHDINPDNSLNEVTILECRTCLHIMSPTAVLFNIFQKWNPPWDGMENTIAEDLEKLSNVKVKQSDKHSKVICRNCYEHLHSACAFITVVKQSDQILRQRYPLEQEIDNVWPKPIQIDKSFNNSIKENSMNVDIKQEALSDNEYDDAGTIYENGDVYAKLDIKVEPEEMIQQQPSQFTVKRRDTQFEYESARGPSTKKTLCTEIVHKKCGTTYSTQDFKLSETQSTDDESQRGSPSIHPSISLYSSTAGHRPFGERGSPLQIIGDIVIEHDNNEMEVDDENSTIHHVQKPRQIIGVRLNKAPKSSAERGREFRARKALLKQLSKQTVEIATEEIRSAGLSEEEKRAKSAEATRRWRERKKGVSESSKKPAKTAAQRMREYRQRKKL